MSGALEFKGDHSTDRWGGQIYSRLRQHNVRPSSPCRSPLEFTALEDVRCSKTVKALTLSTHHDTAANHTPSDRIVILMAAGFERTDRLLRKQAVLLLLHSAPAIVLCGCMR